MRYNDAGFLEYVVAMPDWHAEGFLNVSRSQKTGGWCAPPGPPATAAGRGLDTKGQGWNASMTPLVIPDSAWPGCAART